MPLFSLETHGLLSPPINQEWLLTNGMGSFASSTVVGCNSRRYHGLLCAALSPPVGRIMALSRVAESLVFDDEPSRVFELGVNQFREYVHPNGYHYLRRFGLDQTARWEYAVEGVSIVKELQLCWKKNVIGLRYTLKPSSSRKVRLTLAPFTGLRDFHGLRHAGEMRFDMWSAERQVKVAAGDNALSIVADAGHFEAHPDWWFNHYYAIENDRGMDDSEDLYTPGQFVIEVGADASASVTLWASTDAISPLDWDEQLRIRASAIAATRTAPAHPLGADRPMLAGGNASPALQGLVRAANDFVVSRKMPNGGEGATIIAGYPWFADWGRDTMISLPGLLLVTGRFEQASQVLSVFAQYVSQGMIPNLFDDYTNQPHYNTVDASLWFIHAAFEFLRYTGDTATFEKTLRPACRDIINGYRHGTRFNIRMDAADGLIDQGDEHTQLTWMDAKTNGVVFTPRQGKPVEINALWYHALCLMEEKELAAQVADSFKKAFWISPFRGLYDVVCGGPSHGGYAQRDATMRPNQIFAASLPNSPLTPDQQRAVVEVVRRELLTPMGLRSLNKSDSRYCPRYKGNQFSRDSCYHNGTVWAWLIGPFLSAFLRSNGRTATTLEHARGWLGPLIDQMHTNCIGQIGEIYEAEEPHRMVGCAAQAWSVAEVLRLAVELEM